MADVRQYRQDPQINHGTTAQSNLKLTDIMPVQHENLATQTNSINKISLAQCLCEPFALCNSNNPSNGQYTATCSNFPDFALSYTDSQGNSHDLVGLKVRVKFTYGVTYGSTTSNPPTCPTLNINGSGAIPMLAQGKTMGKGAISAEQTVEFTIIPYGNTLAFDADSNVRESTSDYTIYTDGIKRVSVVENNNKGMVTSDAVYKDFHGAFVGNVRMVVPAFISSSSSRIYFTIPKKIDITKISVLHGIIRTIDGYAVSASGGWIDLNTSDYSISVEYSDDIYTTLSIQAVTPNKWYKANTTTPISNNTPISLQLNITCIA